MPHLEPERLVLLALGDEAVAPHETSHLDGCPQCRADMDSLRDVAGLGRQTQRMRDLPPPPEHVWQRIRAELTATGRDAPPPAVGLHSDPPPTRPGAAEPGTGRPGTSGPSTAEPGTGRPGTSGPGTAEPGTGRPGTSGPGTTQPGTGRPSTAEPGAGGWDTSGWDTSGWGMSGWDTSGPGAATAATSPESPDASDDPETVAGPANLEEPGGAGASWDAGGGGAYPQDAHHARWAWRDGDGDWFAEPTFRPEAPRPGDAAWPTLRAGEEWPTPPPGVLWPDEPGREAPSVYPDPFEAGHESRWDASARDAAAGPGTRSEERWSASARDAEAVAGSARDAWTGATAGTGSAHDMRAEDWAGSAFDPRWGAPGRGSERGSAASSGGRGGAGDDTRRARNGRRRRRRGAVAVAVAVVAALAGVGGTALFLNARDDGTECRSQDARARLQALEGAPGGAGGYACVRTFSGQRRLVVHADGMPVLADGDYEAWLVDDGGPTERIQALGVLGRGPKLSLVVNATVDVSRYSIVDISAEPHDGSPLHSGQSMLRGRLP